MSDLLARAGAMFVAPAAIRAAPPPAARMAAVLAPAALVEAAAGGVAARLRRESGARAALACVWSGSEPEAREAPLVATRTARRLAERLRRRELPAEALGGICLVRLGPEPAAAARAMERLAGTEDAPLAVSIARREPAFDALLAAADVLVAVGTPESAGVTALAAAELAVLGPPVQVAQVPGGAAQRALLRRGLRPVVGAPWAVRVP